MIPETEPIQSSTYYIKIINLVNLNYIISFTQPLFFCYIFRIYIQVFNRTFSNL